MITKADIEEAIKIYEQARSCWKVGLLLYVVDYTLPITKFYYELRNFFQQELSNLKLNQELSMLQIEELQTIIDNNEVSLNSFNKDIVNLYNTIVHLLVSHDLSLKREAPSLLRYRFNT